MDLRKIFIVIAATLISLAASAQVENAGGVRKRTEADKKNSQQSGPVVSGRMQQLFETTDPHDADLSYLRQIYRQLDLTKVKNAPLYFPEDVIDGQENLFRILLKLVVDGKIPAYEYLDGREIFSDQYKINVPDMLERFGIFATEAKGSTERNPKFSIEEADVPTTQVLNYYIIEKWEFDRRSNRMQTRVEAICPVLSRTSDFGGDTKYPMFWVKYDVLRPYLAQQHVFLDDDNNLTRYTLDDYFNLTLYDGEIYKTKNLRNLSMAQMFPDEDDRKRAQDSIDNRLRSYGKDLWVPTREEYLAMKEKEVENENSSVADSIPERTTVDVNESAAEKKAVSARSKRKSSPKVKKSSSRSKSSGKAKVSGSSSNAGAAKSVRRRKR